ncbi:hypothetical protein PTTG_28292 [Puccinia triticina 1-1 BBBD Race 1]|uniref:Uncharacterized protein n=1 Tax=Puccinia triticina (isolate 1-1 / race 1 (BBBD)) TaxID=630390 RepID=A0A180GCU8_PUCT1|nr:hypothetical protein PTTG_28292 [Puccinia triticina 1-1 BBBD Race 1]
MSDTKIPLGQLYTKPRLGAIPGLRTIKRQTPKNPTIKSVLGPQLSTNDFFKRRLGCIPSSDSHGEGPSFLKTNKMSDPNENPFLLRNAKGKGCDTSEDVPEETTFQPRLTEPPPHVSPDPPILPPRETQQTGQVDLNSLIAKMRFQRKLNQARLNEDQARHEEDRACCEAEENRNQRRPFEHFHNQHFFTPDEDTPFDPYYEAIAQGIIHSSVHSDLLYDLVDFDNSAAVYEHLVLKFRIINRAKQLHTWEVLKKISLCDFNSSAEAIAAVDQCARSFREQGVELSWDTIISFIFQGNLNDHLGPVVDQKVDLFMETHDFESAVGRYVTLRYSSEIG